MMKTLFPAPYQVAVAKGPWLHSVWLGLWMVLSTLVVVFIVMPIQSVLGVLKVMFGGLLLCIQHLGYGLFGHLTFVDMTPQQWLAQGLMLKLARKAEARMAEIAGRENPSPTPSGSREGGFTLIELLIALAIVSIVLSLVMTAGCDTAGRTEARARANADAWIAANDVKDIKRMSCAHDSDGDGYGSCTIVTNDGEKIYLQCVAGWLQGATGASSCKEVDTLMKVDTGHRRR